MLTKFAYLGQSDCLNWVMWQVKDPCLRPGWDDCLIIVFFIYVIESNRQWNSWILKMTDYLKGSIVKLKLNFENALENKHEQNIHYYSWETDQY